MDRKRRDGQFLPVKGNFLTKPSADIGRDDRDLGLGQAKARCQRGSVRVWHLNAHVKVQMLLTCVPMGNASTGFDGQVRLAVLRERTVNDAVGLCEGLLDVPERCLLM